ncbi:MAG: outer membrane protein assembly factor BamD [Chthoniobacterales bacterium]
MKSSLLPPELPKIFTGVILGALFTVSGFAQDTLIMKNNQERPGEILSVTNKIIHFKSGPAESTIPLDQVASVTKAPTKEFETAQTALKDGDYAQAAPALKVITDKFLGLPSPWVEQAAAQLGEAYIGLDQVVEAEKAFASFQAAYPQSAALANIGLAQLAIAKKNFPDAKTRLTPIIEEASKVARADGVKGTSYGQAYFLMGQIEENEGNKPEALRDYLTTVTIFNQDPVTVKKASEKANKLKEQKSVTVP